MAVTHQCKRRACRKAESPSMTSRMATVSVAKAAKMKKRPKPPPRLLTLRPMWITMVQSTSESSAEKGERIRSAGQGVFTGKAKTKVRQSPATMRWKLKRDW